MIVRKIETSDTVTLQKILQIHDDMPLAWDPTHQRNEDHLAKMLTEIQASPVPQGFWILAETADSSIQGILWAVIKQDRFNEPFCSVNSLWLDPSLRKMNLTSMLASAVIVWAKEHQAKRLECSTHFENTRMREILEKQALRPGYVQYTLQL